MIKLYVWIIPADYRGFSIGYTNTLFLWALAENLTEAKEIAFDNIQKSTYPMKFRDDILKIIQNDTPRIHEKGTVGMF